jgi:hypothetical protein
MTDELQTLRARIARLEAELDERKSRDDHRGELLRALTDAGVGAAMPDALTLLEGKTKRNDDGTWRMVDGTRTLPHSSIAHVVKRFLETRQHLVGGEPAGAQADDRWPRGADGKRLAIADLTQEELWELAGEWPGKEKPKLAPVYASDFEQHATIEAVNANDTSEQRTKDLRQAVQSDRRYTPAELSKMDNEELWLAAGPFPK